MVYDLIVEAEGYRSEVYKDTLGYETIAYGHLLLPHQKGVLSKVTESEGLELLKMDIGKAIKEFKEYWVGVELCDARQAVLIDMTYNLGIVRWPKLTKALKQGDYKKAAVQIMDSKYAEQVGLRAKRNACIMRDGVMFQIITQNWENNVQM